MKEYLRMKDAFWCNIKFGNHGVCVVLLKALTHLGRLTSGMLKQQDMPHMLLMNMMVWLRKLKSWKPRQQN